MPLTIVGAGMAGLLAANLLQRHDLSVIEKADALPNNHSAVLRFRSSAVGDAVGIPFRKVNMIKEVLPWKNPVADAMAYSFKNTGLRRSDRSITSGLVVAERYIAPPDFINKMACHVGGKIYYDMDFDPSLTGGNPVISTMPMPALMEKLGYESSSTMDYAPAVNIKARVRNCDAYVSLMVPDPNLPFSRISITGDEMIIEVPNRLKVHNTFAEQLAFCAADLMGIDHAELEDVQTYQSVYAKILPMDEDERREFIYQASIKHNIFSLGRFATWRPGLLLDDLLQDIRKIEKWIGSGGKPNYSLKKEQA